MKLLIACTVAILASVNSQAQEIGTHYIREQLSNDTRMVVISDFPMFYNDSGVLKPVNLNITLSGDIIYDYEAVENDMKAWFKATPNTADSVKITRAGHELYFQPMSLSYRNIDGQIQLIGTPESVRAATEGNMIKYEGIFGEGTRLIYTFEKERVKQDLIIDSNETLPYPEEYMFGLACFPQCYTNGMTLDFAFLFRFGPGVSIFVNGWIWDGSTKTTTNGTVEFRDSETLELIYAFDLPETITQEGYVEGGWYELKKQGGKLYVTHRADWNIMRSNRFYPITIDPSVAIDPYTEHFNAKVVTCTDVNCCGPGGMFGACVKVYGACTATGTTALMNYAGVTCQCPTCAADCYRDPSCCKPGSGYVPGGYYYAYMNLSAGITEDWDAVTITEANATIIIEKPDAATTIGVSHVNLAGANCSFYDYGTCPAGQPSTQTAAATMNFTVTDHVQFQIDYDLPYMRFGAYSPDNAAQTKDQVTDFYLTVFYTVADTTPPDVIVSSPLNGSTYTESEIDLNVTNTTEAVDTWWYEYNQNGTNITFSPNTTFIASGADGLSNLTVYANDSSGNINVTFIEFIIELVSYPVYKRPNYTFDMILAIILITVYVIIWRHDRDVKDEF